MRFSDPMMGSAFERRLHDELAPSGRIELISTDVFDTLLLRTGRSERSRLMLGERLFSQVLTRRGWEISPDLLLDVRLEAQRLAFRALKVGETPGEVRLVDLIERQLRLLGLPGDLAGERLKIEIAVEKRSLVPNRALGAALRRQRRTGVRIIAISDTTLPAATVGELIRAFHGPDLVEAIYSSADHGLTKRDGDLYAAVAQAENVAPGRWLHLGDDPHADVHSARSKGVAALHLRRGGFRGWLRSADGAMTEAGRVLRTTLRRDPAPRSGADMMTFGREVLGPIVAQFCQRIWLYAAEAEATGKPVLLFCARGGVGIRAAFERVLARLDLPLGVRRENLMISRLVAARAAVLRRSHSAIEELDREFRGAAFADVAAALGGRAFELPPAWRAPFSGQAFVDLLFGPSGAEVLAEIRAQNDLFERHLRHAVGEADRLILCDTGLYGSTQRLLADGFPDLRIETVHLARSNYKGHSEQHFPKVAGVLVERNGYSPFDIRSCVLRYWQLIESLFEPATPSVRLFSRDPQGAVVANCGDLSYGVFDPSTGNRLLAGVIDYVDHLPAGGGLVARRDAERAWRRLKRAIIRPGRTELQCLDVGARSVDFGRAAVVRVLDRQGRGFSDRLKSIRKQLWREGAISREFPVLRHVLLPMLELAHSMRALRRFS